MRMNSLIVRALKYFNTHAGLSNISAYEGVGAHHVI